ncbi:MAG: stage II sporulation protein M [Xanthomonadaceae bacterium]|jgi:uncharacterized membrane protein SpoIIM required for sporulation|nr:stage II sporulation protein M [Xanthomonadaceae bacterium]
MKQEQFVARYRQEWRAFEAWLESGGARATGPRVPLPEMAAGAEPPPVKLRDEDVPLRYRRLCQQLALARRRGYTPQVTGYLQQLMQRGHSVMYRTPPPKWRRAFEFLVAGFPQLVRRQWPYMLASTLLFSIPLVAIFVALQINPELIHSLMSAQSQAALERMYDPAASHQRLGRDSGTDWYMFGHYIMNNTTIGLRTFASGLLAGVGTILVLVFNGVMIGAAAGHLQAIGSGDPFWRFVAGHGSFELTAIVITGGAGLRLGFALMAPGRRRRVDSLIEGGVIGARLCLGAALMFFIAAFIEAFWSSIAVVPAWGKFTVAGVLWMLVLVWLARGGLGGGKEPMDAA